MIPSSLIIVTDRGSLKAYRVDETPTRGPSLQLVQAFNITDAHGKLVDKVSDLAGRFPVNRKDCAARRGRRLVVCRAGIDPRCHCRSFAGKRARPDRRTREIRSG